MALTQLTAHVTSQEPRDLREHIRVLATHDRPSLDALLEALDRIAELSPPREAARAFAAVADALAMRAGKAGGLRSGPACNPEWLRALRLLRQGQVCHQQHSCAVAHTDLSLRKCRSV